MTSGSAVSSMARPRPDIGVFIAPRTTVETKVAALLGEILNLDCIGMNDSFLALGGDSLSATLLLLSVQDSFGVALEPSLVFDSPTIAALSAAIDQSADTVSTNAVPKPCVQDRPERIPLASEQQSLFRLYRMTQDKAGYNTTRAVRVRTRIDLGLLRDTLTALLDRHELLRTRIRVLDDVPAQFIDSPVTADLEMIDLRTLPAAHREEEAGRRASLFFRRPFDVESERLFRACLIRLADDDQIVALSMQHLVIDGGSLGLILSDLGAIYAAVAGKTTMPPRAKLQYADYALWQRSAYAQLQESHAAFWATYLEGLRPVRWQRPTPEAKARRYKLEAHAFNFSPELTAGLKNLGRHEDVTLGMILFAANQVILAQLSGTEDIVGGMMFSRRTRPEFQDVIGPMFMIFPVRTPVRPGDSFSDLVRHVKASLLEVYAHLEIEGTAIPRSWPTTNFNLVGDQDGDAKRFEVRLRLCDSAANVEAFDVPDIVDSTVPIDFSIELSECAGRILGRIIYCLDFFDAEAGARAARDFQTLLAGAVNHPGRSLSELLPVG